MRARVLTIISHDPKNDHGRIKLPYKGTAVLHAGGAPVSTPVRAANSKRQIWQSFITNSSQKEMTQAETAWIVERRADR